MAAVATRGHDPGAGRRAPGRRGRRRRRQELRAEADGGGPAGRAAGPRCTTCRGSPTSRSWPRCCAGSAATVRTADDDPDSDLIIDAPDQPGTETDYDLVRRLRASICVLGPLLARRGRVRVAHPGGDAIGSRGLDMHVGGLARMGAEITGEHGFIVADRPGRAAPAPRSGWTSRASAPPRTCSWPPSWPRASPRSTTPPASRRSSTSARCSPAWAPTSPAPASSKTRGRGRTRAAPGHAPHHRRPDRRRHLGLRCGDDPRRRHGHRHRPGVPGDRPGQGGHRRAPQWTPSRTASGSRMDRRPDRAGHRDAAVPRLRHRPAADGASGSPRSATAPR